MERIFSMDRITMDTLKKRAAGIYRENITRSRVALAEKKRGIHGITFIATVAKGFPQKLIQVITNIKPNCVVRQLS